MSGAEVAWWGASEIAARVRAGELDPQAVVPAHLERIARLDGRVHAYVHVDGEAKAGAAGALAGVTLAVKDTQPVAGMPWTYGSARWRNRIAGSDAVPIQQAREAGAAILGKVNTPEMAAAVGTTNEIFPATENPWRAGFTPGGSSGGSAAAVAAALATVATGDDFGGSIRIPSSCCGVVGLRPSPGRVAQEIPDPTGLNSRGPIARSVRDVRLLYQVMAGVEAAPAPMAERRRRIAMADTSPLGVHPACQAACRRAADVLAAAGHEIQTISWEPMAVAEGYRVVRPVTMAGVPGEPEEYGDAVRELIREGREIGASDFFSAHQRATAAAWRLNELVASRFDAILTPTLADPPMPIPRVPTFLGMEWDRYTAFVLPVSFSRLPAISVPAGLHDSLPVGVQLVGRYRREWDLLALAEELEQMEGFGYRPPPGFE